MKRFRLLRNIFLVITLCLSHLMCVHVAYSYCELLWCGQYGLCSAPASTAFLFCIPYGAAILICLLLAWWFHRKAQR